MVAINDRCTINRDGRRPMVRSIDRCLLRPIVRAIVASCDRSYEHSWHPVTERAINCCTRKPDCTINHLVQRSIVASCDRSYDQSLLYIRPIVRSIVAPNDLESQVRSVEHLATTLLRLILPWRSPTTSATSRTFFLLFAHDSTIFRLQVGHNLVVNPV